MSPITDYNLGRAHGRIVVDYDKRGTDEAQEEFEAVEEAASSLENAFEKLRKFFKAFSTDFVGNVQKMAAAAGAIAGVSSIFLGMSRATGNLNGSIFKLRGALSILGALGILLGGVPKSVQNFPSVIKKIITLSAAITLFAKSGKLLDSVLKQLAKFVGSTKIIQTLTRAFPGLTAMLSKVGGFIPTLSKVGSTIDGWGKPIHQIARMALTIGGLIAVFKTGTKLAVGLTKAILKMGAGAMVIQGLIFVVGGLVQGLQQLSGILGLLPGMFAVAGLAGATFAVGMQGISDAMKKLNASQAEFDAAIKNLAPAAQDSMRALRGFREEWDALRRNVQENLFGGLGDEIRKLGDIYLPVLRRGLGLVAFALNDVAKQFSLFAQRGETVGGVNKLFDLTAQILRNLGKAMQPLMQALLDIAIVSSEVLAGLTSGAGEAAEAFAAFTRNARETGALRQWIEDGVLAFARLVDIIWTAGQIIATVFNAFDSSGDGFLLTVNKMLDGWLEFLRSVEGQSALSSIAELLSILSSATRAVLEAGLKELGPILVSILPLIEELATTFSAVLVAAIQILGPLIRGLAEALSFMAPVLGPILGFFLAWSVAMSALGVILTGTISVIGLLASAISSFLGVIKILGKFLIGHPLFAALLLLATIAYLIIDNWEVIGPKLKAIWEGIAAVAVNIWNAVVDFFVGIWDAVSNYFIGIWEDISSQAKDIWQGISDFFTDLWETVAGFFTDIWNDIVKDAMAIWNWAVEEFRGIWEPIVDIVKSVFSIIEDLFVIVFGGIAILFIAIWNKIRDAIVAAWTFVTDWLTLAWQGIVDFWHSIWDPAAQWFIDLWTLVSTAVQDAWNVLVAWLTAKWEEALAIWHTIFDPIVGFFQAIWDAITNAISIAWNWILNWLTGIWQNISNQWKSFWGAIGNWFSNFWNSDIIRAVRDGVASVVSWIKSLPGKIWGFVKDAGRWLWDAGKAVIEGFLNGLKDAFRAVRDWVGGIADWVRNNKGPLDYDRKLLIPAGIAIMSGLLQGLQSKEGVIKSFLQSLTTDIGNGLNGANALLTKTAETVASSATVGILTNLPSTEQASASSAIPVTAPANGVSRSTDGTGEGTTIIQIQHLDLNVAGNLDPTKPAEWREAMKNLNEELRKLNKGIPNG